MRVRSLELNNVRQFQHKRLIFGPGFNLLVGENGAGKSTVLRAILTALGHSANTTAVDRLGDDDIRFRAHEFSIRLECEIGETSKIIEVSRRWRESTRRNGNFEKQPLIWFGPNESSARNFHGEKPRYYVRSRKQKTRERDEFWWREEFLYREEFMDPEYDDEQEEFGRSTLVRKFVGRVLSTFAPKFERFAWRFMPYDCAIRLPEGLPLDNKKIREFRDEAKAEIMRFLEYDYPPRRYRHGWGNRRSIIFKANGMPLDERKHIRPLHELREILTDVARRTAVAELASGVTVEIKLAPRIYVFGEDGPFLLSQLSDGEKRIFSMVVDIARQLSVARGGLREIESATGLIVIDEIDCHLHPKWQRMIVKSLEELFPACQFIATTHSPFVVQSVEEHQLQSLGSETLPDFTNRGIEEIAFKVMRIKDHEVSPRYLELLDVAKQYYTLVEQAANATGAPREELKARLRRLSGRYMRNPAFQAYLEMKGQGRLGPDVGT